MRHANFWHVGNWCIYTGQKYIESPFLGPTKGVEVIDYAQPFVDALQLDENATVKSELSWDGYALFPRCSNYSAAARRRLSQRARCLFTRL